MPNTNIKKLSPAAAKLLLAMLSDGQATFDEMVEATGIHLYRTLAKATTQLRDLGFVIKTVDGTEHVTLVQLGQSHEMNA